MTLIIGVHNGIDFVIGSDTLAKKILPNNTITYEYGYQKLYPLGTSTMMIFSGEFSGEMRQFVIDFAEHNKTETDINHLVELLKNSTTMPKAKEGERIKISFAGYIDGYPAMRSYAYVYGKEPYTLTMKGNIFATGFDNPQHRAFELLNKAINKGGNQVADMRKMVKSTLLKCIREFKDSDTERLGGNPDMHILKKVK